MATSYRLPPSRNEQQHLNVVSLEVLKRHRVANVFMPGYVTRCPDGGSKCCMCRSHGRPEEAAEFGCMVPRLRRLDVALGKIGRRERLPRLLADASAFVRDVGATDVAEFVRDNLTAAVAALGVVLPAAPPAPAAAPATPATPAAPVAAATPKKKRVVASQATRASVWSVWHGKDALTGKCYACDGAIDRDDGKSWHASHLIARAEDGPDLMFNLVPQCAPCNIRQRTEDVDEYALANFPTLHKGRNRRADYPALPAHMLVRVNATPLRDSNV